MSNSAQKYTLEEFLESIEQVVPEELSVQVEGRSESITLARGLFASKLMAALKSELADQDDLMNISGLGAVFKGVAMQDGKRFYGVWTILYEVTGEEVQEFEFRFELLLRQETNLWALNRQITEEVVIDFGDPNVAEA